MVSGTPLRDDSVRGAVDRPGGGPGFGPAEPDFEGAVVIGVCLAGDRVDQMPDMKPCWT
ncbi:hypothetical protein Ae263Ps1_3274c [Pseudonocardia sp. Ae263_Ps1]|nr:hypothetical protein Ae150APs1_2045 [Pseudonocardia sp. Ae150A_Ps1]OLL86219.1 hypothetical protein Ae263Ps1_3274c [Pseudonocardia sp. Ae263_Ps1]OLL93750.1 hypothetical protein Ae356Ps1_3647 [Pseudonocardia sp. Ae356_Ps1]